MAGGDDEALDVHASGHVLRAVGKDLGVLIAARPELIRLTPMGRWGVSL